MPTQKNHLLMLNFFTRASYQIVGQKVPELGKIYKKLTPDKLDWKVSRSAWVDLLEVNSWAQLHFVLYAGPLRSILSYTSTAKNWLRPTFNLHEINHITYLTINYQLNNNKIRQTDQNTRYSEYKSPLNTRQISVRYWAESGILETVFKSSFCLRNIH